MNKNVIVFSDEQLDFIKEMMNIGAGNAATALEQMLGFQTDLKIPLVKHYTQTDLDAMYYVIGDSDVKVTAVVMNLVGQVKGKILFVVPEKNVVKLITQVQQANPAGDMSHTNLDFSIITEIGNILAGTYLSSIQQFCMLNIYHTLPKIKNSVLRFLINEQFPKSRGGTDQFLMFSTVFITPSERIVTYLLFVPDFGSTGLILESLQQAKDKLSIP